MDIMKIRSIFGTLLPDWKINSGTVSNIELLINQKNGEKVVFVLMKTDVTGTERAKPQIRVFTDKMKSSYKYAIDNSLRFFCFILCVNVDLLNFTSAEPNHYLLSIESKFEKSLPLRIDLRSLYDKITVQHSEDFFRVLEFEHSTSIKQGAFIKICDSSGNPDPNKIANLNSYIYHFDNRPYMNLAYEGNRIIFSPSVLYTSSTVPKTDSAWNWLVFGAPGTGKSYFLDSKISVMKNKSGIENVEFNRITFYEDYTYSQFVGCYMPLPVDDSQQDICIKSNSQTFEGTITGERITYKFSPGPFAEMLVKSFVSKIKGENKKVYILIIEELNRANAASVFGDIFQLLDREKGISTYELTLSESFSHYLSEAINAELPEPCLIPENMTNIKLPDNLYIWATMNSADQGVFPLDSAFRRRWTTCYMDIHHDNPENMLRPFIYLPCLENDILAVSAFSWNHLRNEINRVILDSGLEEDRCVGYWFFNEEEMEAIKEYSECSVKAHTNENEKEKLQGLSSPLTDKLLAYLRQDVFRNIPTRFFKESYKNMSAIRRGLKYLKDSDGNLIDITSITELPENALIRMPDKNDIVIKREELI